MGCGSANFPGCCGCTSTLLTFGDCFSEADDTLCVEERLGSRRLADESFVLLAFVSVPFPVFLSSPITDPCLVLALIGALPSVTEDTFVPKTPGQTPNTAAPLVQALTALRGPSLLGVVLVSAVKVSCVETAAVLAEFGVVCLVALGDAVELVFVHDMGVASRALTWSNWFFRVVNETSRSSRRALSAFSW